MPGINFGIFSDHPEKDSDWDEEQWKTLLTSLVEQNIFNWREVTSLALGHLNPSQVGTSIASNKNFQSHFAPRTTWLNVRAWHFRQQGCCADCGTRLELQADHLIPKEIVSKTANDILAAFKDGLFRNFEEMHHATYQQLKMHIDNYSEFLKSRLKDNRIPPAFSEHLIQKFSAGIAARIEQNITDRKIIEGIADQLENMVLRCRRCNVIRRPSHSNGGLAFLTTEAALMWILFVKRPTTYQAFKDLCRDYGMTMATIRFEEAWAMAKWLNHEGAYHIDDDCKYYTPLP